MKTRVRQLANGKWVAEAKKGFFGSWKVIDKENLMRAYPANYLEYSNTRAEALALIPHFLAHWGY